MSPDQIILNDFIDKHPIPAAQVLEQLNEDEVSAFIQELPIARSLLLLGLMNADKAAKCFVLLPPKLINKLIENSDLTLAESICRQLDAPFLENLLAGISPQKSAALKKKLEQMPNTVGVLMVPAIVVNEEMTVWDAVEVIKSNKENLESYLYVVDLYGIFKGAVGLKELLFNDGDSLLKELMITEMPRFFAETPIRNILEHPAWYEYRYVPVIDKSDKLLGTLPYIKTKEIAMKVNGKSTKEILETGSALSELYLVGLTGLLQSFGEKS
ncbi:MAG: CBS domain-containing protein [Robiginitalea sp.]|uniref:CBS domain-containing protein n=1 Tax=Robiginitalea sp. TaxID=1902411 RepID=UPI003C7543EF